MGSDRIARLSERLALLSFAIMLLLAGVNLYCWLDPSLALPAGLDARVGAGMLASLQLSAPPAGWQLAGGALITAVPLMALARALWHGRTLFKTLATGEYFSLRVAAALGGAGRSVGLWVLLSVVCQPLLSVWLTLREPVGHRLLRLGVGSPDLVALYLAGGLWVMALVMRRAAALDAENRQFV